jgi:hypothetical protein
MNISDFTYILQNPVHINAAQTDAIASITKDFPYFQAARVVHLKGLKNQDSFQYNQHLRTTAAYTTDRSILFDFITSKNFEQHTISNTVKESQNQTKEIEVVAEEVKAPQNLPIEEAIETKLQEANAILDPNLFQPKGEDKVEIQFEIEGEIEDAVEATKEKSKSKKKKKKEKSKDKKVASEKATSTEEESIVSPEATHATIDATEITNEVIEETTETTTATVATVENTETPEETLQLGKPLTFNKNERHSFAEWLQLTQFKPIDRTTEAEETIIPQEKEEKEPTKVVEKAVATEKQEAVQPTETHEVTEKEKPAQTVETHESTEKEKPEQATETHEVADSKEKRFELIDKFIDTNPKITPKPTLEKNINLASAVNVDQSMLMTETLAKVYLEQKKYKKAITAYNILILKYPEKSSFFADQIQAIKKLQQNN